MRVDRRKFAWMAGSAAALLASGAESLGQAVAAPGKKIGYCVVGLGRISVGHFMPGTRQGQLGRITALVSGDPAKAKKLAAEYGVPDSSIYSYADFDKIKDNPAVDAVYIGLPNSMHREYTIRAAQAGKHVLCEKPMATSVADCKAMIAACEKANRKLMIAYRCQLLPVNLHARELVRNGTLGKIQSIESTFGFDISAGEWRLNRKLAGGGPLMDVGVYSLNACRWLLGEEPTGISAYSSVTDQDGRFTEVEENLGWVMKFPSGVIASCNTTYGARMPGFVKVHGSQGTLLIDGFDYQGIHTTATVYGPKGEVARQIEDAEVEKDPAQFGIESDHFSDCLLNGKEPGPNGTEGLHDMEHISRIYKAAGLPSLG